MARLRHTPEQIIGKLREGEQLLGENLSIEEVCKHLEVSESTWHRWQREYGGIESDDAKRFIEPQKENARLKTMVADQTLDIDKRKELDREPDERDRR
ncbi:transposase [Rhodococcus wratislaviensis]|uniref:transposase n=1 Tax=Rhodococcus wratislaviensis TaxID=44752 RepID=UPI00364A0A38